MIFILNTLKTKELNIDLFNKMDLAVPPPLSKKLWVPN